MNLFPDQISAAGARQFDAQLQLFRIAAGSALDGAEQFAALQFSTTRGALDKSTELLRQVAAARDPRDLLAIVSHGQSHMENLLAYQRKLFGIATAMSGAIAGLPPVLTPAASAALQKLASLPPVASSVTAAAEVAIDAAVDAADDIVEHTADLAAEAAASATTAAAEPEADDIIEQTNEVVEELAAEDEAAEAEAAAADAPTTAAPDSATPAEKHAASADEPIATLSAVAAATGHTTPHPSAAPMDDAGAPVQVEQVQVEQVQQVQPVDAQAPVSTAKSGGRQRKK